MTMMFDDTIKLYAAAAEDDHNFGDESEDDHNDLRQRFDDDDDEEEEVTMTSDDDDELGDDEDETTHAEDASIFTLPPSPVRSYECCEFDQGCEACDEEGRCSGEENTDEDVRSSQEKRTC